MRIRPKIIMLTSGMVFLSIAPLSAMVLLRNRDVLRDKTFEVCRTLGDSISNLAREELLVDETYDATRTALNRVKGSAIQGLLNSYVVNFDGRIIADLHSSTENIRVSPEEYTYFMSLRIMELREIQSKPFQTEVLRFAYPIFIRSYQGEKMRVGTAVFDFDKTEIYKPINKLQSDIILISVGVFSAGLVISMLVGLYFTRPIHSLSEGADMIRGGDLSHRIAVRNRDEFGDLARTFNKMTGELQDMTQHLEQKVERRTLELNNSLREVRDLKVKQDGDYYLTSLLMEPLQKNNNVTPHVITSFILKQKKQFIFKKWESEIGGDFCITDTIPINGRNYTVFMNADAMGKSLQGAGGALVMGAVFQAILARSKRTLIHDFCPEFWLRDSFLDLESIFISFNGSMLMSLVMGLLDHEGMLYYINAEHPRPVLYRDGRANFIEERVFIPKLGTNNETEHFIINILRLKPGDVFISGSDGRDDILVWDGDKFVFNEDDEIFLRYVEECDGDLDSIVELLHDAGKIIDDLSLMRVYYEGAQKDAGRRRARKPERILARSAAMAESVTEREAFLKQVRKHPALAARYPELIKMAAGVYFKTRDYRRAWNSYRDYLELRPEDNQALVGLADSCLLLGNYREAAHYAERLYLRDPEHDENLRNLARAFYELREYSRAGKMMLRALDQDPDAPGAREFLEKIKIAAEEESPLPVPRKEYVEVITNASRLFESQAFRRALVFFEKAARMGHADDQGYRGIGDCYLNLGRLLEARLNYNRSLAQNPKNPYARNNLGIVYYRMGWLEKSRAQFERARKAKRGFKAAKINLEQLERFEKSVGGEPVEIKLEVVQEPYI